MIVFLGSFNDEESYISRQNFWASYYQVRILNKQYKTTTFAISEPLNLSLFRTDVMVPLAF